VKLQAHLLNKICPAHVVRLQRPGQVVDIQIEKVINTAMLEVQNEITSYMDDGQGCLVYSVDLSAAFGLLRKDTFAAQMKINMDQTF